MTVSSLPLCRGGQAYIALPLILGGTLQVLASTAQRQSVSRLQHRISRHHNSFPRAKLAIAVRSTAGRSTRHSAQRMRYGIIA
jgi:hypothetical protein